MKDRLLTFALAVGALLAFSYYFVGPVAGDREEVSRPLSTEARDNGYLGARRWIESHDVPVFDLRQRFDSLAKIEELPASGNLLITSIPFGRAAREWEFYWLRDWVADGNAVLVAGSMFDTPDWSIPETYTLRDLDQIAGLQFRDPEPPAESGETEEGEAPPEDVAEAIANLAGPQRLAQPKAGRLVPRGDHPLTEGVAAVAALSEFPAGKFRTRTPDHAAMLALMKDEESGLDALWLIWEGKGTIIVSGYGSIFTNKLLGRADNARLLANAVTRYVAPGGYVIFDDIHQGAASFYDADAFFADSRLHATLGWIGGLWLLWVLGTTRLPVPPAGAPAVREEAFLALTGNFFARVLDRRRAAARLFAGFLSGVRGRGGGDDAPWSWMQGVATVEPALLARVRDAHRRLQAGGRVDLVSLHNDLQRLGKQLR